MANDLRQRTEPKKQQHTAKRIFERLRDEHGFTGGITIVKEYVACWRQRAKIALALGSEIEVMFDGGIRSGQDGPRGSMSLNNSPDR